MNRLPSLITAILTLALSLPANARGGGDPPGVDPLVPGRAIVRLPVGGSINAFLNTLNSDFPGLNAAVLDTIASRNLYFLSHAPISSAQLDNLETALEDIYPVQGAIVYGELVYEDKAPEGSTGSIWVDGPATMSLYQNQYAGTRVGLDIAHATTSGASTVVAVLDTGVEASHPTIAGRIVPGGGWNFMDNTPNTADVGDGIDSDNDGAIDEMVGHGTYVAGLITFTAPQTRILPVTVLNSDGIGHNWILTKGIFYAIDRGVEVINLSLTSTYDSVAVFDGIIEAASRGIVTVAAAGNWGREEPREYPAMEDDIPVIGVAATNDVDVKGDFSNYNERLYLSASGASMLSGGHPIPDRSMVSALPGSQFAFSEGTSMATPLVSGAVALIRSQHPEWPAAQSTTTNIRLALRNTAVDIDDENPQYAGQLGHGRIDVGAAVQLGPPTPTPGDLDNDGAVDVDDLITVILDWGQIHSSADVSGNGTVEVDDLITVILNWG